MDLRVVLTVFVVAAVSACRSSASEGPPVLSDTDRSLTITDFTFARETNPSAGPLETRLAPLDFEPTHGTLPNFGYTRDRLYARLTLTNASAQKDWVLRLANPHLRNLHVLIRTSTGYEEIFNGGYQQPAADRFILQRDFCIPFSFSNGNTLEVLVVTETGQWLGFIPSVATRDITIRNRNRELGVGLFGLGGVIFVLLFNLLLWASTRDETYALYVLASVTTHLLAVPGATGTLNYLFPQSPLLQETLWHASAIGWLGFTSYFARELLVKEVSHVLERRALTWSGRLGFALMWIPIVIGPNDSIAGVFNVLTGLGQVLIFAIAIKAAVVWKDRVAAIFMLAWGGPIFAGVAFIAVSNGLAPVTDTILYLLSGSSVWEVVMMALALGFRINLLQRERLFTALKLREANTELTRQISDRSVQLFSALRLVDEPLRWNQTLPPGTEINGRYRIEKSLGEGAMGAVYVVRRLHDDTQWAMKIAVETRRETLARFAREAHIGSLIRHPNVVHIEDLDISATGFMFIVLELVDGQNLRDWLTQHAPASPAVVTPIVLQVAQALRALHAKQIAHRDLKPANVLLSTRPDGSIRAKLADFGVSSVGAELSWPIQPPSSDATDTGEATRELDMNPGGSKDTGSTLTAPAAAGDASKESSTLDLDLTKAGRVIGTPRYIAPELVHWASSDYLRADIYAFGVMAYQLLTAQYPFTVLPFELDKHELKNAAGPKPMPAASAALEPLIRRCLSFDAQSRPTAEQLVRELEK